MVGTAAAAHSVNYEELYCAHRPRVLRLCRLLLSDPDEAHDVSQEVFVKVLHQLSASGEEVAWGPWLNRVTVNACRDRWRAAWWRRWRDEPHGFDEAAFSGDSPTPEQEALGAERRAEIWRAFRGLPARQREVFALRFLEECSTEETAEALGVTGGSVKRHLFRAVQRMRGALRGES
jgi:RNA polymerase sigma-70 factor, ECF subfamily